MFLPSFHWYGSHQIKAGTDLDRVHYWQNVQRTGYENVREDGTPVSEVRFGGSGLLGRSNYEASSYVEDTWKLRPKLLVEAGVRGTAASRRFAKVAWPQPELAVITFIVALSGTKRSRHRPRRLRILLKDSPADFAASHRRSCSSKSCNSFARSILWHRTN